MTLRSVVYLFPAVFLFSGIAQGESVPAPYDRTFKAAPIVVSGTISEVKESGELKLQVDTVIKGGTYLTPGIEAAVDVSSVPTEAWPSLGMRVVMGLAHVEKNRYRLHSRFGSILPAEPFIRAVQKLLGVSEEETAVPAASPSERTAGPEFKTLPAEETDLGPEEPIRPAIVHVMDTIESQVMAAELIAIGRVVEVGFSKEPNERAVLRFIIETTLLGGGVPDLIEVHEPLPDPNFSRELRTFRTGRYCLFLRSGLSGGGLDLVSPYYGVYYLENASQEAMLKEKILATPAMRKYQSKAPILTTIQANVSVWQEAWNAKDLKRLITCYSKKSGFRRLYDAGSRYRMALDRKVREFPGSASIKIVRVKDMRKDSAAADVELLLDVEGARERRSATMRFTKEDGEWRILDEGF